MNPRISLEFPQNIKINETVIINYTVDWIHEDGTILYILPLNPHGIPLEPRPHRIDEHGDIRYLDIYGNDVLTAPKIRLTSEFIMLTDSIKPKSIEAATHVQYMRIRYAGEPIFFSNETIHGSIKFQLKQPLMHHMDYISIAFHNATRFGLTLQLSQTEYGVRVEQFVSGVFRSPTYTMSGLSFNDTTQKWSRGDQEFETLPNGLPDYIPKPQPISQSAPPSTEIRRPFSLPQEHWGGFAEFLRSVEKNQDIKITKEWLMDRNATEDFVGDFLNAYPEFLTKNIIFSNFFIYPMPSAVDLYDFIVYGHYNTQ